MASLTADAFYDEWQALLAPFTAVATSAMMAGVSEMYDGIDQWKGELQLPFPASLWQFITAVGAVRKAGGQLIAPDGPRSNGSQTSSTWSP